MFVREVYDSPLSPEQCREALLENTIAEVWINEPSNPGDIISRERRHHLVLMPRNIDEGENRDLVMKVKMTSQGAGARVATYTRPTIEQMGFALCFITLSLSLLTWGIWTAWSALARGSSITDDRVWLPVTVPLLLLGMYSLLAWGTWRQSQGQSRALRSFVVDTLRATKRTHGADE